MVIWKARLSSLVVMLVYWKTVTQYENCNEMAGVYHETIHDRAIYSGILGLIKYIVVVIGGKGDTTEIKMSSQFIAAAVSVPSLCLPAFFP